MIKKISLYGCVMGLGLAFVLSGCGAAKTGVSSKNAAGIVPSKSVLLESAFENGAKRTSELTGTEEFADREMNRAASVYSKPEAGASVLGTLAAGTQIQASSISADGAWMQIVYNGRVAYVPSETVSAANNTQTELPVANFVYNYDATDYLIGTTTTTDHSTYTPSTDTSTVTPTQPTQPAEDPTEPTTDPTEPNEDPTEPATDPTEPNEDPTEPTDPGEVPTDPVDSGNTSENPTEPGTDEVPADEGEEVLN